MPENGDTPVDTDEDGGGHVADADNHGEDGDFFIEFGKDGWGYLKMGASKTVNVIVAVIGIIILAAILAAVAVMAIGAYMKIKALEITQRSGGRGGDEFEIYTEDEEIEEPPEKKP